jgi:hypothetical protein
LVRRKAEFEFVARMFRLGEIAAGELVGLAMRQVAVKWNTTDERRVMERVRERRTIWGAVGR